MKKIVFESLNEFINNTNQEDTYLNHVLTGMGDMPEYESTKALLQENSDLLSVIDEMKNSVVDWSWDDVDPHNGMPDNWAFDSPQDREGVREIVIDILGGMQEYFSDADIMADASPYIEKLEQL